MRGEVNREESSEQMTDAKTQDAQVSVEECGAIHPIDGSGCCEGAVCIRPKGHDKYHATRRELIEQADGGQFWYDPPIKTFPQPAPPAQSKPSMEAVAAKMAEALNQSRTVFARLYESADSHEHRRQIEKLLDEIEEAQFAYEVLHA